VIIYPGDHLGSMDLQIKLLVYTLSCIEIIERGSRFMCMSLEKVPRQKLTILQILFESIYTYISFMSQKNNFEGQLRSRVHMDLQCLMTGVLNQHFASNLKPVLLNDAFSMLIDFSLTSIPTADIKEFPDILKCVQMFWALEITKCFVAAIESMKEQDLSAQDELIKELSISESTDSDHSSKILAFCGLIISLLMPVSSTRAIYIRHTLRGDILKRFCTRMCLPFLNKCALLYYTRFGIRSSEPVEQNIAPLSEIDGLCQLLKLPCLEEMCHKMVTDQFLSQLVSGWCIHYSTRQVEHVISSQSIILQNPRPFKILEFPPLFNTLLEKGRIQKCKRCKTLPIKFSICLFCGEYLCFQELCCTEATKGECYMHSKSCGLGIGAVLIFTSSEMLRIVLFHNENACIIDAPYLDCYGQV
jgi:E3 ubiquitin-protein ligase UBR1